MNFSTTRGWTLVALVCAATLGFAQSSNEADTLLDKVKKMAESQRFAAVRKSMIRDPKGGLKTFEERVLRDKKRQRIEYLDNSPFAGQIVIEDGGVRKTYVLAKNEIYLSRARPFGMQYDIPGDERRRSDLSVKDGGTIAGLKTRQVMMVYKGQVRQAIWVEPGRGLVVKRAIYDSGGQVVGGFEYQKIDFKPRIKSDAFDLPKSAKVVRPRDQLASLAKSLGMQPYTLPTSCGYQLMFVHGGRIDGKDTLRQMFDSKDGRVSLIQVKGAEVKDFGDGKGRITVYAWEYKGTVLALIGDVDMSVLRRLASQVTSQQPE